jgi:hypothetical protein
LALALLIHNKQNNKLEQKGRRPKGKKPKLRTPHLSATRRLSYLLLLTKIFIQTTGIWDGASDCGKILTCFYDNLDVSDPTDPEVIIKIDVDNEFNSTDRGLTLDVLSGHVSRDYVCGLKTGDVIPTCDNLSTLFVYFKSIRTCEEKLRYFDWDGQVHIVKGKTGGQQRDPLEMLIFLRVS